MNVRLIRFFNFVPILTSLSVLLLLVEARAADFNHGTVVGTVRDAQSHEPLAFTNVFLANTTLGDAANEQGEYLLENVPTGSYQLVISRIGYKMFVTDVTVLPKKSTTVHVELEVESIQGEEISVEAQNPRDWRRDFKEFKRQFLGESSNAKKCKILNPDVLTFERDAVANALRARADSILIVENRGLGYRIEIILDQFQWSDFGGRYFVYPKYSPLDAKHANQAKRWQAARKHTFETSMRGFFASMAQNEFRSYQLLKYVDTPPGIPSRAMVIDSLAVSTPDSSQGLQRLNYNGAMQVTTKTGQVSNLFFNYGFIDFDKRGNVYPADGIKIQGYWGLFRVADSLPFDYWPNTEVN